MANPFLAEVRMFSFNFPPKGWAFCQGQLLPINQNQALFSLLGTTYGGNGTTNFALPDLRGRTPIHWGTGGGGSYVIGQVSGEESHSLLSTEMAQHTHAVTGSTAAPDASTPTGNSWAAGGEQIYAATQNATMHPNALASMGGGLAHPNMQPYLVVNFSIALQGIFPSRN